LKANVFVGKYFDQILYVVRCVRACAPWKFIDNPLGRRAPWA